MAPFVIALYVVVLVLMLLVLLSAVVFLTPFVLPMFGRGAPYVPSGRRTTERMLDLGELKPGERMVDLGSGDGRIVIAAAQRGAQAHGVEINPWLICFSRMRARWTGVGTRASFRCGSLWAEPLGAYDVVTVYGLGPIMGKLERKLEAELKPGARVVSHAFHFPHWLPVKENDGVFLYVMKNGRP
ncbi:MAG: hypothetical protein PHI63_02835 [Patescibacteria group bacterium]|nr:hypothetical protein [Patescibacteria group bacterium]